MASFASSVKYTYKVLFRFVWLWLTFMTLHGSTSSAAQIPSTGLHSFLSSWLAAGRRPYATADLTVNGLVGRLGSRLVVGARNRTYPIPIPCSESIPEPIPCGRTIKCQTSLLLRCGITNRCLVIGISASSTPYTRRETGWTATTTGVLRCWIPPIKYSPWSFRTALSRTSKR